MDRYPVELLGRIATYACTDDGRTGCSLSAVSRHIRDATSRVRYNSVALFNQSSVVAFEKTISTAEHHINIFHLLIATPAASSSKEADEEDDAESDEEADEDEQPLFRDCVINIIRIASPTLRTLFLHLPVQSFYAHLVLAPHFPFLRDLSVPNLYVTYDENDPASTRFPELRRLHVSSHGNSGRWKHSLWRRLSLCTPLLETLRLSTVNADGHTPNFLRVLLHIPLPPPAMIGNQVVAPVMGAISQYPPGSKAFLDAAEAAEKLPKLKTIFVQCGVYVQRGWCFTGWFTHSAMLAALYTIANQTEKGDGNGHVYLLKAGEDGYVLDDARRDWLSVVDGGTGPWSTCSGDDQEWVDRTGAGNEDDDDNDEENLSGPEE